MGIIEVKRHRPQFRKPADLGRPPNLWEVHEAAERAESRGMEHRGASGEVFAFLDNYLTDAERAKFARRQTFRLEESQVPLDKAAEKIKIVKLMRHFGYSARYCHGPHAYYEFELTRK